MKLKVGDIVKLHPAYGVPLWGRRVTYGVINRIYRSGSLIGISFLVGGMPRKSSGNPWWVIAKDFDVIPEDKVPPRVWAALAKKRLLGEI